MLKKSSPEIIALVAHYKKRLGKIDLAFSEQSGGVEQTINFLSPALKKDNHPRILYHGEPTQDVIILTHGLSDSPYYVKDIGKKFYKAGCNVILTLLPGHGRIEVGGKMEEEKLKRKWKKEVDAAVNAAKTLGKSLFSAALDLGYIAHGSNYFPFAHTIARYTDGNLKSIGTNPYRYPYLNNAAGLEVVRLIDETWKRLDDKKIDQPVFIAHSVHDVRVSFGGIQTFMTTHVKKGFTFLISENIAHSQLVLKKAIKLDLNQKHGVRETPIANPKFNWMMENAIRFFQDEVVKKEKK